jgi:hypothetical protein
LLRINIYEFCAEKSQVAACNAQIKRLQDDLAAERRKVEENLTQKSLLEAEVVQSFLHLLLATNLIFL